jgi:hypothetical protein
MATGNLQYNGQNITFNGQILTFGGSDAPDQPTFGLPADVVALIESKFGTVANYLRLRNQGQI